MSELVRWKPAVGLLRVPVSGDPELTSGLVAKVLKKAPRTASKKLDANLIEGGSRLQTSQDAPGDRRLPLSAMITYMRAASLPIANLLNVIAAMSEAKRAEFQQGAREILPLSILLVSENTELRDHVHGYVMESVDSLQLEYYPDYDQFRVAPGIFLQVFVLLDAGLGREAIANIATVMRTRSEQLGCKIPIFVLVWSADEEEKLRMPNVQTVLASGADQVVRCLPPLPAIGSTPFQLVG